MSVLACTNVREVAATIDTAGLIWELDLSLQMMDMGRNGDAIPGDDAIRPLALSHDDAMMGTGTSPKSQTESHRHSATFRREMTPQSGLG